MRAEVPARADNARAWSGVAVAAALALMLCGAIAPAAIAKIKIGNRSQFSSKSVSVALGPASGAAASAPCPSKTHVTGGGFNVTPGFIPSALTGARSIVDKSLFGGKRLWSGTAVAYASPPQPATFTVKVQCENDSLIKKLATNTAGGVVPIDTVARVNLTCPAGLQVLSGGAEISAPPSLTEPTKIGALVLESRRTAANQWTVTVLNPTIGASSVAVTGIAVCEQPKKKSAVSEVSSTTPIGDDARSVTQASCSKKQHVVSGGFSVTPNAVGSSTPAVSVDQSESTSKRAWSVGLYEFPTAALPAGSTLTAIAYCKKGK
jgi:hypothetical protein